MAVIQVEDCQTAADVMRVLRLSAARRRALGASPRPIDIDEPQDPAPAALERNAPALQLTRGDMVKLILRAVCAEFDVSKSQILGDRRGGAISRPRQAAMYLIHGILGFSLPQTGRIFDRDHTTVMHARNRCIKQLAEKTLWGERIARLEMSLRDQWHMPKYDLFRYVPIRPLDDCFGVEDYLKLGWLPTPALEGTYHGQFSVLMKWICPTCRPLEPTVRLK
jgi:hypothetical protein